MSRLPHPNTIQPTDGELLVRFVDGRDESAFRELVERHGGLVQAVCRRVLNSEHDVDDAFQATFLVLVRDAAAIRSRDSVASWLFKVAHRVAVRAAAERRKRREQRLVGPVEIPSEELSALEQRQAFEVLAAELNRLPEQYRNAMLVFYLEGRSREDAAEQLDCTDAALKARLARGRRILRHRLIRRGITLSLVLGSQAAPSSLAAEAVSPPSVDSTVAAGAEYAQTGAFGSDCSPMTVSLAKGTTSMTSFTSSKLTLAAGVLLAAACLTGVGLSAGRSEVQANPDLVPVADDVLDTSAPAALTEVRGSLRPAADVPLTVALQNSATNFGGAAAIAAGATAEIQRPPALDLKQLSEPEKRIEEQLKESASIDFFDTPLRDAMEYLSDAHDITILLDEPALIKQGLATDEPITQSLSGTTLRSTLNITLKPLELTYVVEDDVMKITTMTVEKSRKETRAYPVQGLIDAGYEVDRLAEIIEQSIRIDEKQGDVVKSLPGLLIITQSQHQHRLTHDLLDQLYRAQEATQR